MPLDAGLISDSIKQNMDPLVFTETGLQKKSNGMDEEEREK